MKTENKEIRSDNALEKMTPNQKEFVLEMATNARLIDVGCVRSTSPFVETISVRSRPAGDSGPYHFGRHLQNLAVFGTAGTFHNKCGSAGFDYARGDASPF
jgi:hypothetical protein